MARACAREASGPAARPGIRGSTASVGVSPIQCRWKTFSLPGSSSESAYERVSPPYHQSCLELLQQDPGLAHGPAPGLVVARRRPPCRPGRRSRGWCRRRCPASPRPCPGARRCPDPPGQPSPSSSRPATNSIARLLAGYRSSQERLVAGPAPHQGHRGRVLRRLVGVARVRVGAEVDRAVRGDLVHDLAAVGVDHRRDVAQRPQVVLDHGELAGRDRGEGGVLAVGAEQPGVVRPAGAEPAHRLQRALRRRVPPAGLHPPQVQVVHPLLGGGQHLLGPAHAVLDQPVPGQVDHGAPVDPVPLRDLGGQRPLRVVQRLPQLGPRIGRAGRRAADARTRRCAPRRPAAGPRSSAGHRHPCRTRCRRSGPAGSGAFGPEAGQMTAGSCGPRKSSPVRAAVGFSVEPKAAAQSWRSTVRVRRLAPVAEQQVPAADGGGVGQVLGGLARGRSHPRGRSPSSSEWASARSVIVRSRLARRLSPTRAPETPFGTKSVRLARTPSVVGRSART